MANPYFLYGIDDQPRPGLQGIRVQQPRRFSQLGIRPDDLSGLERFLRYTNPMPGAAEGNLGLPQLVGQTPAPIQTQPLPYDDNMPLMRPPQIPQRRSAPQAPVPNFVSPDTTLEQVSQATALPYEGVTGNEGSEFREGPRAAKEADMKVPLALLAAGLGMLASKSPYALQGIGEGGMAGLSTYLGLKKEEKRDEKDEKLLGYKEREVKVAEDKQKSDAEVGRNIAALYKARADAETATGPAERDKALAQAEHYRTQITLAGPQAEQLLAQTEKLKAETSYLQENKERDFLLRLEAQEKPKLEATAQKYLEGGHFKTPAEASAWVDLKLAEMFKRYGVEPQFSKSAPMGKGKYIYGGPSTYTPKP